MTSKFEQYTRFTKNKISKPLILGIIGLNLFLSASSCKKKSESPTSTPEEPKDEIVYSEFKTAINLQSVLSFSYTNSGCGGYTYPLPSDSSATYNLDVNGDQVPDFSLKVSHSPYTGGEYCGHCPTYNYFITINGLNSDTYLAAQNTNPGAKIFEESTVINTENTWVKSMALRYQQCTISWDFSGGYVGIKIGSNFGYLHINSLATNGIQIKETGFNKTVNRPITCGQK